MATIPGLDLQQLKKEAIDAKQTIIKSIMELCGEGGDVTEAKELFISSLEPKRLSDLVMVASVNYKIEIFVPSEELGEPRRIETICQYDSCFEWGGVAGVCREHARLFLEKTAQDQISDDVGKVKKLTRCLARHFVFRGDGTKSAREFKETITENGIQIDLRFALERKDEDLLATDLYNHLPSLRLCRSKSCLHFLVRDYGPYCHYHEHEGLSALVLGGNVECGNEENVGETPGTNPSSSASTGLIRVPMQSSSGAQRNTDALSEADFLRKFCERTNWKGVSTNSPAYKVIKEVSGVTNDILFGPVDYIATKAAIKHKIRASATLQYKNGSFEIFNSRRCWNKVCKIPNCLITAHNRASSSYCLYHSTECNQPLIKEIPNEAETVRLFSIWKKQIKARCIDSTDVDNSGLTDQQLIAFYCNDDEDLESKLDYRKGRCWELAKSLCKGNIRVIELSSLDILYCKIQVKNRRPGFSPDNFLFEDGIMKRRLANDLCLICRSNTCFTDVLASDPICKWHQGKSLAPFPLGSNVDRLIKIWTEFDKKRSEERLRVFITEEQSWFTGNINEAYVYMNPIKECVPGVKTLRQQFKKLIPTEYKDGDFDPAAILKRKWGVSILLKDQISEWKESMSEGSNEFFPMLKKDGLIYFKKRCNYTRQNFSPIFMYPLCNDPECLILGNTWAYRPLFSRFYCSTHLGSCKTYYVSTQTFPSGSTFKIPNQAGGPIQCPLDESVNTIANNINICTLKNRETISARRNDVFISQIVHFSSSVDAHMSLKGIIIFAEFVNAVFHHHTFTEETCIYFPNNVEKEFLNFLAENLGLVINIKKIDGWRHSDIENYLRDIKVTGRGKPGNLYMLTHPLGMYSGESIKRDSIHRNSGSDIVAKFEREFGEMTRRRLLLDIEDSMEMECSLILATFFGYIFGLPNPYNGIVLPPLNKQILTIHLPTTDILGSVNKFTYALYGIELEIAQI